MLGLNSPEWFIGYLGGIMVCVVLLDYIFTSYHVWGHVASCYIMLHHEDPTLSASTIM